MASLYITEYQFQAAEGLNPTGNRMPAGQEPAITTQKIAIGGSSVASAAFNVNTRFVKLHADAICSILFGATPVATAGADRIPADATCYYGVVPGQKVAVITNS